MTFAAVILLAALLVAAKAQQKPKPDCTVLRNYQDHVRAEVRGMKESGIAEPCPVKKAPAKKKPTPSHTPASQRGQNG